MLGVCETYASIVQHPISLLCVCFEIIPENPFRVSILFYQVLSVKLLILICLTSLLNTTLAIVRCFPFCFRKLSKLCRLLEQMKTDYANHESLVVRCVLFSYYLCLSISKTEPLGKAGRETNITCALGLPYLWFFMPAVAYFNVAHSQNIAMFITVADTKCNSRPTHA